jgi:hypothetical protein
MSLDEAVKFSGAKPMKNLEADLSGRTYKSVITDLTEHDIVAA